MKAQDRRESAEVCSDILINCSGLKLGISETGFWVKFSDVPVSFVLPCYS